MDSKAFIGWLIALSLPSTCAWAQVQRCEVNGAEVSPNNGATTAGRSGIMRCRDAQTGELTREQELRDGRFLGLQRFYDKGVIRLDGRVNEQGNRDGLVREYAPGAVLQREASYINGAQVGAGRIFHPNGQLRRLGFSELGGAESDRFRNSRELASAEFDDLGRLTRLSCANQVVLKAHGFDDEKACGFGPAPSLVEIFRAARVTARQRWSRGQLVGEESYFEDGSIRSQMVIVQSSGQARRNDRSFHPNGQIRSEQISVIVEQRRQRESETEFSERGTPVVERRFQDGRQVFERQRYLNGQPRSEWLLSASDPQRPDVLDRRVETTFYDSGVRSFTGSYAIRPRGVVASGVHQRFDDRGVLRLETVFDEAGRMTRERSFNEAGSLERDDAVFEDGSRRAFTKP
jgi:antitoxin component YwqK of YwqJK toxin-antitoxin module